MPPSGETRFYPLLDSVLYRGAPDDLPARYIGATAAVLLDIAVHHCVPVLSQSQVIDSSFVLDLVQNPDSRLDFLTMVERGLVRARFLQGDPDPITGERYSALSVFRQKLRDPGFEFSAWPELSEPEARRDLAAFLDGVSSTQPEDGLGERIAALKDLDAAFRFSEASEVAIPVPPDQRLGARLATAFGGSDADPVARSVWTSMETLLVEANSQAGQEVHSPDSRSSLRRLLPVAVGRVDPGNDALEAAMSAAIDLHYNCVVATSIGAVTLVDETAEPRVPIGLRESGIPVQLDARVAFMLNSDERHTSMSWSSVAAGLGEGRSQSAERRLDDLVRRREIEIVDGRVMTKVIAGTPRFVVRLAQAAAAAGAGAEAGVAVGQGLVGAALGAAVEATIARDKVVASSRLDRLEERVRKRAIGRLRRSFGISAPVRMQ